MPGHIVPAGSIRAHAFQILYTIYACIYRDISAKYTHSAYGKHRLAKILNKYCYLYYESSHVCAACLLSIIASVL